MKSLMDLPPNLPIPTDDHAADHLTGAALPAIVLKTTASQELDLSTLIKPTVIFFYPRTGEAHTPTPDDWDLIPGARGCTPQSCGFRDLFQDFKDLGFQIYGFSSQSTEYQKEFVTRNHIPFEIISDEHYELTDQLNLPTFEFSGVRLIKRMAWIIHQAQIMKVFYPVFPPNENAAVVLQWLRQHSLKSVITQPCIFNYINR